jgi:hypothetical protein
MRIALVLLLAAACGGAPPPAPAPAVAPAPAAAPAPFEATDDARRAAAIDFLAAIARRDRAATATMTGEAAFCEILERKQPDKMEGDAKACADEMVRLNAEVLTVYEAGIPETFVAGNADVQALDAEQGIYVVIVEPEGGGEPVSVFLVEVEERRFVVFPRKKEK